MCLKELVVHSEASFFVIVLSWINSCFPVFGVVVQCNKKEL